MPMEEEPVVGAVYEDTEGRTFTVVGFDADEGTIEIEYESGTAEQLDIDSWYELDLEMISSGDEDDDRGDDEASDYDDDSDYLDEEEDLDEEES